jgi:hypothetical protein
LKPCDGWNVRTGKEWGDGVRIVSPYLLLDRKEERLKSSTAPDVTLWVLQMILVALACMLYGVLSVFLVYGYPSMLAFD